MKYVPFYCLAAGSCGGPVRPRGVLWRRTTLYFFLRAKVPIKFPIGRAQHVTPVAAPYYPSSFRLYCCGYVSYSCILPESTRARIVRVRNNARCDAAVPIFYRCSLAAGCCRARLRRLPTSTTATRRHHQHHDERRPSWHPR